MKYADKMYDLAFHLLKQAPWRYLEDSRVFAFVSPSSGETIYCDYMGKRGEYLALGAFIGEAGMQSLYTISENGGDLAPNEADPDFVYSLHSQNCVQCSFLDKEEVDDFFEDQKESLVAYAKKNKKALSPRQGLPVFQDFHPLHQSETIKDPVRLKIMEEALEVAVLHAEIFRGNYGKLPYMSPWAQVEVPSYEWKGDRWVQGTLYLPEYEPDYGFEYVPFVNDLLRRRLLKLGRSGTLDVEMIPFFSTVQEGDAILFPEALFTYHREERYHRHPIVTLHPWGKSNLEAWSEILQEFIQETLLNDLGHLPEVIFYRGERTYYLLCEFCEALDIPLEEEEDMPELDEFYESAREGAMDGDQMVEDMRNFALELLEGLPQVPKGMLKTLPQPIKDLIRNMPEEILDPEDYKKLKSYVKYL